MQGTLLLKTIVIGKRLIYLNNVGCFISRTVKAITKKPLRSTLPTLGKPVTVLLEDLYQGATGIRSSFCLKFTDDLEKEIGSALVKSMDVKNAEGVPFKSAKA